MKLIKLAVLVLFTSSTFAASGGGGLAQFHWYGGLQFGFADADLGAVDFGPGDGSFSGGSVDDTDESFRILGGMWLTDHTALELGYVDLGRFQLDSVSNGSGSTFSSGRVTQSLEADGYTFGIRREYQRSEKTSIIGRFGFYRYQTEIRTRNGGRSGREQRSETDYYLGLGVARKLSDTVKLSFEFERYEVDDVDVDIFSIGATISLDKWIQGKKASHGSSKHHGPASDDQHGDGHH